MPKPDRVLTTQNIPSWVCKFQVNWTQMNKDTKLLTECTHHGNRNSVSLVCSQVRWVLRKIPVSLISLFNRYNPFAFLLDLSFFYFLQFPNLEGIHYTARRVCFIQITNKIWAHTTYTVPTWMKNTIWALIAHAWNSVVSHWAVRTCWQGRADISDSHCCFHSKIWGENRQVSKI